MGIIVLKAEDLNLPEIIILFTTI